MRNIVMDFLNKRKKTADDVKAEAEKKRSQIMSDGNVAKRLMENPDFKRFCEILLEDRDLLNANLIDENDAINPDAYRTRLIARINQIDKTLGKPKSMIWQMENLTEVRTALQVKSRVGQAHGNHTGGEDG